MDVAGKIAVVTGGAAGIGAAIAARLVREGARVWVIDLARPETEAARQIRFHCCDVSDAAALQSALAEITEREGRIDLFVSNAGVLSQQDDHAASASDAEWHRCWSVNVMAHVVAARVLLPPMISRGSGHFVLVASAAGLLNQIGDAAYSATKHAAVSFAESLAIEHADDGIGVTLVCPQYVATSLIGLQPSDALNAQSLLTAEEVAQTVMQAVAADQFLVLPHAEVRDYALARAQDHDRWIKGMRKLRARAKDRFGAARPEDFYKLI